MYARYFKPRPSASPAVAHSWSTETRTNERPWIRQVHRWTAIVFTLTVIANFAAMAFGEPPPWVVYSPLPPLFLLLFTGLYLFALPYVSKWRAHRFPENGER